LISITSFFQSRSEFLRVPGIHQQIPSSSSEVNSAILSSANDFRIGVPATRTRPLLQLGGMDWDSDHATAEWLQTIDINVIQPTPNISPCSSMRSVSDQASSMDHGPGSRSERMFDDSKARSKTGSRRHTQPNLLTALNIRPKCNLPTPIANPSSLLGLPAGPNLSGSCEKLSIQPSLDESENISNSSLQTINSVEENPQMICYKVPNLRRTISATANGGTRNNSLKVRRSSPIKRADSASVAMKRCDSDTYARKNSSGSTSATDEASDSVSFHLMVPQLSMDCPSQDVSRASSPSSSPTPPSSPLPKRPLARTRVVGMEGRGVLRRQFARDYTQPAVQLPTYPEEEETANGTLTISCGAIKPPPGYRDHSPSPSLPSTPLPPTSPISLTSFPYPLSPSPSSMMRRSMSPIPPPPSPLYSRVPSSPLPQVHSPLTRVRSSPGHQIPSSPLSKVHSPLHQVHSSPISQVPNSPSSQVTFSPIYSPLRVSTSNVSTSSIAGPDANPDSSSPQRKVGRQESYAAMIPISFDIPDEEPDDSHETPC